jgi:NADH-quinone oxidoreductase subunit A
MLAEYTGVLVVLAIGTVLVCMLLGIHLLLGPKRQFAEKMDPFECGEKQIQSPHRRYAVKFYMVAILFVVFDVEAIFLFPWAVRFRALGGLGFAAMLVFLGILLLGYAYAWKKGALEWV